MRLIDFEINFVHKHRCYFVQFFSTQRERLRKDV